MRLIKWLRARARAVWVRPNSEEGSESARLQVHSNKLQGGGTSWSRAFLILILLGEIVFFSSSPRFSRRYFFLLPHVEVNECDDGKLSALGPIVAIRSIYSPAKKGRRRHLSALCRTTRKIRTRVCRLIDHHRVCEDKIAREDKERKRGRTTGRTLQKKKKEKKN